MEMKILMKYRTTLNSLLLAIYFISLLTGVFHHHHFDFTFTQLFDRVSNSGTQDLQIQSGTEYTCIIHQNITNLQTALVNVFNEDRLLSDEKIFSQSFISQFCINQIHLTENHLRAPPALS